MKFRHIKFTGHPILGNLELDFRHNNGSVYNNIVFAGENGAGKTVLLEYLYGFSTSLHRLSTDGAVEIEFEVTDSEILEINEDKIRIGSLNMNKNR